MTTRVIEEIEFEYRFYQYKKEDIVEYKKEDIVDYIIRNGGKMVHDYFLMNFTVFYPLENDKDYVRLRDENGRFLFEIKTYRSDKFAVVKTEQFDSYESGMAEIRRRGYKVKYNFVKMRQLYYYKGCNITFDMYPALQEYMEIEAVYVDETSLDHLNTITRELGFSPEQHKIISIGKLMCELYGIEQRINGLTFENIYRLLFPSVKDNKHIFNEVVKKQKEIYNRLRK